MVLVPIMFHNAANSDFAIGKVITQFHSVAITHEISNLWALVSVAICMDRKYAV